MGADDAFEGSEHNIIYSVVTLMTSLIGVTASILMILLLYRMRSSSGYTSHVLLIFMMSTFQLVYDLSFFFRMVNCGYYVFVVANCIQIISSTTVSLLSNWISIIALMIVVFKNKFDANHYFFCILFSSSIPGLFIGLLYLGLSVPRDNANNRGRSASELFFYYIRLLLIFINFLFCGIIIYQVGRWSSKTKKQSHQEIAIRVLSRRMVFYPIIQALGRLCFACFEQIYGFDTNGNTKDNEEYAWLLCVAIITPFVSVGYLTIFLVMQPEAKRQFLGLLRMEPIQCIGNARPKLQEQKLRSDEVNLSRDHFRSVSNSASMFSRPGTMLSVASRAGTMMMIDPNPVAASYDYVDDEMLLSTLDQMVIDINRHSLSGRNVAVNPTAVDRDNSDIFCSSEEGNSTRPISQNYLTSFDNFNMKTFSISTMNPILEEGPNDL
jgi:hypothetical protein